jgi:hypothetical protein
MNRLPADLLRVAAANPVPASRAVGEQSSRRARELREQVVNSPAPMRRRAPLASRRLVAVAISLLAMAAVGTAIGARLFSRHDVERFLPQGSLAFSGTHPQCTVLEPDVAYRCHLATTPTRMTVTGPDGQPAFSGAKFGTVSDDGRVNGGCIGLNQAGTEWACYLGERAVAEGIIDADVLGQKQAGPAGG